MRVVVAAAYVAGSAGLLVVLDRLGVRESFVQLTALFLVAVAACLLTVRFGWLAGLLLGSVPLSLAAWVALIAAGEGWVLIGGVFVTLLALTGSGLGVAVGAMVRHPPRHHRVGEE